MSARLSAPGGHGGRVVEQNADINVTPFVDVMLVLLIIFMVAAPLATVSLRLDLPPPVYTPDQPLTEPVYITVQNSGDIFIEDQPTTLANLVDDVCARLGGAPTCTEERVYLRAQPDVPYRDFMQVVHTLQNGGLIRVGLLNEDIV